MGNLLNGYVVYAKSDDKEIPFGVASDNYDCKAESTYIPNRIKKYLIEIEDRRFYSHRGVDTRGLLRATYENLKSGKIIQGVSTITQQLARNLLRDNRKTLYRKFRETRKAFQIEKEFSKDEILNLYFNNVYFGKNVWGIRAAGLHYFGKEVEYLTHVELLYLLAILRGPNYYNENPDIAHKRYELLNNILFRRGQVSLNRFKKNLKANISIRETPILNIKTTAIPYIVERVDNDKKTVISTIDASIQNAAKQFVSESKYPVSIIAIREGKVVGFSSSYGVDYPFNPNLMWVLL
jgi:penicillin-binding protein 1A